MSIASVPIGGRFASSFHAMRKAQWLSRQELFTRSEARLAVLLNHAAKTVPFYRSFYQERGIKADDVRTLTDLQTLPIFTKSDYRQHDPEGFCSTSVEPNLRIVRKTSGSTGEPFQFSIDRRALPIIFASHLFYDSWHGLRPFDRYVRIVAPPAAQAPLSSGASARIRVRKSITGRLQNLYEDWTQKKLTLWDINSNGAEGVWRCIDEFRPKFVMGYTSTLAAIADELLKKDLRLRDKIKGVITIAETLTPNRKRLIEQYFKAPLINRYGLREFGSWTAQSCRVSPDRFHVNTELAVCEILRQDGTPCDPGETGRVVLTDLHNFARPFIRYDTGDLAVADESECPCGRGFPLLGQVEGRSIECLRTPSGREISPAILGHFLFVYHNHLDAVSHYQLVQEAHNRVRLLIVPGSEWNEKKSVRLRSDLQELIGSDMEVAVETVAGIAPEISGKRPIIKSVTGLN
jgi:phenylacetate-CoA ligase